MTARISRLQAFALVFVTSFCTTPFGFVTLYTVLGRHVWFAGALQAAVCMTGAAGVCLLAGRMPNRRLGEIAVTLLGPWLGRTFMFLLGVFFLLWGPIGDLSVLIAMLDATTAEFARPGVLAFTMLAAALYACRSGVEVVARALEVWGWVLVPGILGIVMAPYVALHGHFQPGYLLPVLPLPPSAVVSATVWSYALGARGFVLALLLAGRTARGKGLGWPVLGGTAAAVFLLTLMIVGPAATFPQAVLAHLRFPVLEALDTVDLAWLGLHSTVTATLLFWPIISWAVVASSLWASAEALSEALGLRSYRSLLLPLTIVSALLASWSLPPGLSTALMHGWALLGYVAGLAGPWLLCALAGWRSRSPRGAVPKRAEGVEPA